ncbi:hypothetical protein ACE14D_08115 [Streptomyces sp. Act-28]
MRCAHLPKGYGDWWDVHNRLRTWAVDSTWERMSIAPMARTDTDEDLSCVAGGLHDHAHSPTHDRSPHKGGSSR